MWPFPFEVAMLGVEDALTVRGEFRINPLLVLGGAFPGDLVVVLSTSPSAVSTAHDRLLTTRPGTGTIKPSKTRENL